MSAQVSSKLDPVGSGAFYSDLCDVSDATDPFLDSGITCCSRVEFAVIELLAVFVDDGDVMGVGVGVDSDEDRRPGGGGCHWFVLPDCSAIRFPEATRRGWTGQSRDGDLGATCSYQVTTPVQGIEALLDRRSATGADGSTGPKKDTTGVGQENSESGPSVQGRNAYMIMTGKF